jgi:hypothetical protein
MRNWYLLVALLMLVGATNGLSLVAIPPTERLTPPPVEDTQAPEMVERCTVGFIEADQNLAQTSCCDGHRGVCGCRAGRIVCCDGTVSDCACHADGDFAGAN